MNRRQGDKKNTKKAITTYRTDSTFILYKIRSIQKKRYKMENMQKVDFLCKTE